MNELQWNKQQSGLALREDEFSWQASFSGDGKFYLRRSKDRPDEITDLLFGVVQDDVAAELLAEFVDRTGSIHGSELTFSNIAELEQDRLQTIASYDRVVVVTQKALQLINYRLVNNFLEQDGRCWNAVMLIEL